MKRIGILGGTFNPIHIGHLAIAQAAKEALNLDKVIFVPAHQSPHKNNDGLIAGEFRYDMVRLAVSGNTAFNVSDFEIKRPEKSYSILMLEHFKKLYPKGAKFFFIIGADMLGKLHTWHRINEILKLADFVAISRKGFEKARTKIRVKNISTLDLGLSSTYIRQQIKNGKSVQYLVPDKVINYIKTKHLYRKRG